MIKMSCNYGNSCVLMNLAAGVLTLRDDVFCCIMMVKIWVMKKTAVLLFYDDLFCNGWT